MDVTEFWDKLEYRVSRELARLGDPEFQGWWCDGFLPDIQGDGNATFCVTGTVWIGIGPRHQESWNFELILDGVTCGSGIDWSGQLPPNDATGWLSLDRARKLMRVEPRAAYPDRKPAATTG